MYFWKRFASSYFLKQIFAAKGGGVASLQNAQPKPAK